MPATSLSSFALHILTSNEIVSRSDFRSTAKEIIAALGGGGGRSSAVKRPDSGGEKSKAGEQPKPEEQSKPGKQSNSADQSKPEEHSNPERYFHLRVNTLGTSDYLALAEELVERCNGAGVSLIINERVDIALAAKAHGVQLGRGALSVREVRESWGDQLKIGVSIHSAYEAAQFTLTPEDSRDKPTCVAVPTPDWLVAGHVFPTQSHPDQFPLGLSGLQEIVASTSLPVIAIGGVSYHRLPDIRSTGARGAAVISDVWDAKDPQSVVTRYLSLL